MSGKYVTTFTNEDVQTRASHTGNPHRILRRISSPLLEQPSKHDNRQSFHIPYLRRCPSPRIQDHNHNCTTDTIDARSARFACVHVVIVNISALMDGEILIGFAVCFQRGLVFTRCSACITGNTLAERSRPGPTLAPLPCGNNFGRGLICLSVQ